MEGIVREKEGDCEGSRAKWQGSVPRRDRNRQICRQGPGRAPIKQKPRNFKALR